MYPLSIVAHAFLSMLSFVICIWLIVQAIKKPLFAVKLIVTFVLTLTVTWSTVYALHRGLSNFEGDKNDQMLLSMLGGFIMFFACLSFLIKVLKIKDE